MSQSFIHVQPLQLRLFSAGNDVDIIATAQTVVHYAQQAVRVWRVVDTDNFAASCESVGHEPRRLVGKAIVVVAPGMSGKENIQRRNRFAPGQLNHTVPATSRAGSP